MTIYTHRRPANPTNQALDQTQVVLKNELAVHPPRQILFTRDTDPPEPQWLVGNGAQLTLADGTPFNLRGVNWSGCESRMFPGLLSVRAYKTIYAGGVVYEGLIDQIAALGFNSIRFPICVDMAVAPHCQQFDGINTLLNPDLISPSYGGPVNINTWVNGANLLSPLQILDNVVAYCKELGLRVILDMHCAAPNTVVPNGFNGGWYSTVGPQGPSGTTIGLPADPRSEQDLINAWKILALRYLNEPTVCGFDLVNEPWGTTWDDDPVTGIAAAYERIATAIQAVNPNVLIICEGNAITLSNPPQYAGGYVSWPGWGSNLWGVRSRPLTIPIQNKLCYAPHEYYNPKFGWCQDYRFPATMIDAWDTLWGFIVTDNIAPVIMTEWGGNFNGSIANQTKWAYELLEYMRGKMGGKVSWMHWAMVPGSYTDDYTQDVVGLIKQRDEVGGADTIWPMQQFMVEQFIAGSQNT